MTNGMRSNTYARFVWNQALVFVYMHSAITTVFDTSTSVMHVCNKIFFITDPSWLSSSLLFLCMYYKFILCIYAYGTEYLCRV